VVHKRHDAAPVILRGCEGKERSGLDPYTLDSTVKTPLSAPCRAEGDTVVRRRSGCQCAACACAHGHKYERSIARVRRKANVCVKECASRRGGRNQKLVGMAGVAGADEAVREQQRDYAREHKLHLVLARSIGKSHSQRQRPGATERTTARIRSGRPKARPCPYQGMCGCTTCSRAQDSHGCTQEHERTGVEATTAGQDSGGATANEKIQERTDKNGARTSV
jgi:hypothetical protein